MKSGIAKRIDIEIRICVGSNGAGLTGVGPASFFIATSVYFCTKYLGGLENTGRDAVPILGQLSCYYLIIERKQPTYSGGKSHVSCVIYIDFSICSVVRTYENEQWWWWSSWKEEMVGFK